MSTIRLQCSALVSFSDRVIYYPTKDKELNEFIINNMFEFNQSDQNPTDFEILKSYESDGYIHFWFSKFNDTPFSSEDLRRLINVVNNSKQTGPYNVYNSYVMDYLAPGSYGPITVDYKVLKAFFLTDDPDPIGLGSEYIRVILPKQRPGPWHLDQLKGYQHITTGLFKRTLIDSSLRDLIAFLGQVDRIMGMIQHEIDLSKI